MGINRFTPVGPVETLWVEVIQRVRKVTWAPLNRRMYPEEFRPISIQIDSILDELKGIPGSIKKAVKDFISHTFTIPKERRKYTRQIEIIAKREWFSLKMDILSRKAEEIFRETEKQLQDPNNTNGFLQIINQYWESQVSDFLSIFGNHKIYHIAMTAYEKSHKRHLPRKSEIRLAKRNGI